MKVYGLLWKIWQAWAHFAGILLIAGFAGFGIVLALSNDTPVIEATEVRLLTERVAVKGSFTYVYDLNRLEFCPGEIITVFASEGVPPAVVTTQRPSVYNDVRLYSQVRVDRLLPDSVTLGRWRVTVSMVSHCANRVQTDPIADFVLEVTS